MKILILINHFLDGGTGRVTLNLATEWRDAGAEVVIATLQSEERYFYSFPEGIRVVSLNIPGRSSSVLSVLRNNIMPFIRIRQLLRREKPDIAIAAMMISAIGLAATQTGDEIVMYHEHAHPPTQFKSGGLRWIWKFLRLVSYAHMDAVVVLVPQIEEWLRKNTRAKKIAVIPNWIDLPLPQNEPKIMPQDIVPAGKKLLLAVGRLCQQKRFDRLLDAFARIKEQHGDWHLVILGEDAPEEKKGEFRARMEAQVAQLGLTQQVSLPGFAGNVVDWYRVADALAMTSEYEGFPMVLLEAMAHGCPPISVDCDTGPRDIICNGENGLLVPQDDPDALVDGLNRMLSDEALRKRLASKAVEVQNIYSRTRVNAKWQNLFDESLRERNARTGQIQ